MNKYAVVIQTASGGWFTEIYAATPQGAADFAFDQAGESGTYTVYPAYGDNPQDSPFGSFEHATA